MALHDLVPGPLNLLPGQVTRLADAIDTNIDAARSALSFTFDGTELWDNGYWISQTGFHQHSPLARVLFITKATSVDIDVYANFTPDSGTAIQVYVNGFLYASPGLAFSSGAQTITQSLPAGSKLVTIVGGVQATVSGSIIGTFLIGCEFNQPALQIPPEAPSRLLVYGDSTSQGGGGGGTGKNVDTAWPTQFRMLSTRSIIVEAASGRALHDDASLSTPRAAFVAKLVAMNPASILFLIGTNDHGANAWSAASFGTAYAATIDDLHTALPNIRIYCVTPLFKANSIEGANGSGNNCEDYREQIRTIAAARAPWAVLIEGTAILGKNEMLSESSTWLHPNDLGNRNLALYVDRFLSGSDSVRFTPDPFSTTADVVWANTANVATTGNSIQKNAGTDGAADAGGFSTKAVGRAPWLVSMKITETNKTRVFGVSSTSTGINIANILYGFNIFSTGALLLWENGTGYESGGQAYSANDVYQVRSPDGVNVYFVRIRSGVVTVLRKASIPITPSMYPLFVQANILGSTGTITDAKIHGLLQ